MIVAAALAALAVLARWQRGRAWAMLGALILTPVLLVAEIWDSPQIESVRSLGPAAAVVAVAGVGAMAGLAWLFARRPGWLGVLALAALPFRVPVQAGGATANLLVPLYVVIGAGGPAWVGARFAGPAAGAPPGGPRGARGGGVGGGGALWAA